MKAYIIAEGEVQGVGYRSFVRRVAADMNVKGFVRNARGGSVEVYCLCKDEEQLNKFLSAIERKSSSFFGINVSGLKVSREGAAGFRDFGDFEGFEIRF